MNKKIIFFFLFLILSSSLQCTEIISDEDYYNKGINSYKNAEFNEAFIIFFNLAQKGERDSQFNITNMYEGGVGTTQNYVEALKWCWLCALGGEKKCFKKIEKLLVKIDEESLKNVSKEVEIFLEKKLYEKSDINYSLMLGFWYEKFSPEQDIEKAYLWYSVAVTGGLYKAMKNRNNAGESLQPETLIDLQNKASKIYSEIKYFGNTKDE